MPSVISDKREKNNGSSNSGEPLFLIIGKIRKAYGLKGEIFMEVLTDFPERVKPGKIVFIGNEKAEQQIETVRKHQNGLLIKFRNLNDRKGIQSIQNNLIYVPATDLPKLDKNRYYFHELIGMRIQTEEGKKIGTVSEILETGANDVLVIKQEEKEVLIPFIKEVILDVQRKENVIIVKKQEWV